MTLERNSRRRKRSRPGTPGERMLTVSLPLSAGVVAALAVSLIPPQFRAVTAALLAAVLLGAAITVFSSGRPRAKPGPMLRPETEGSHWTFAATLLGVGGTNLLAMRLPGNLTIGDALLAAAMVGVAAQPGVVATAIRAFPRWFWWSTSLILISGAVATLRPEVTEPGNILTAFQTWWAMALVPFLIVAVGTTPRRVHAVAAAFVIGASLSALAAVAQAAGLWDPAATMGVRHFPGRSTGLSVHPNHLGFASAVAAPIALALALHTRRPLGRYAWGTVWLVLAMGVASSGSRAALGGLLLGSALLLPLAVRYRGRPPRIRRPDLTLPLGLIGVALALWLLPKTTAISDSVLAITSRLRSPDALAASDAGRVLYYSEGIDDVTKYWLIGRGFEESTRDHNIFLQALLSGGVLFLAGLLTYIWNTIAQASRRLSAPRDPILWGALASFVLWPVMGLAQNNLRDRYLFVALGLILAWLRATSSDSVSTSRGQSAARDRTGR